MQHNMLGRSRTYRAVEPSLSVFDFVITSASAARFYLRFAFLICLLAAQHKKHLLDIPDGREESDEAADFASFVIV